MCIQLVNTMCPTWLERTISAELLWVLCEHDAYCSSRLNVNMHLLISLAQKQIHYSSKLNKNSEMQTQNMTQTCNN